MQQKKYQKGRHNNIHINKDKTIKSFGTCLNFLNIIDIRLTTNSSIILMKYF